MHGHGARLHCKEDLKCKSFLFHAQSPRQSESSQSCVVVELLFFSAVLLWQQRTLHIFYRFCADM